MGLLPGECAALRVGSVDPLRRRLRVVASLSEVSGRLIWSTPKTHQSRDVPLPRSVLDQLVHACAGRAADELLFHHREGEPVRLSNWRRRVWWPAIAGTGQAGLTPHNLRYTSASLAITSGASVKHVQRMLGHKDAAMTLNVYASLSDDDLDTVSDRLDATISQAAAACVRPEPAGEIVDLVRRRVAN